MKPHDLAARTNERNHVLENASHSLGFVAASLLGAASLSAAPLRATFEAGDANAYELAQTTSIHVFGQSTTVESRFRYAVDTMDVDNAGATVDVAFTAVRMRMSQGDESVEFDSDAPPADDAATDPMAGALTPLVGASMSLRVSPAGDVESIDDSVIRSNPVLSQLLDAESQRRSLSRLFRVEGAPDDITVGDTWSIATVQDIDQLIGVRFTNTFTVSAYDDGRYTIELSGDAGVLIRDENMPEDLRPELTLHQLDGEIIWNADAGRLERYAVVTDFTLAGVNPQLGQQVQARLKQDQTLRRLTN